MIYGSIVEIVVTGFILVLPFLYESSQTFRYYFKFCVYYVYVGIASTILIPLFCLRPRNVKNLLFASALCRHISPLLGIQWTLHGKEYLEEDQACIIVCNHQSSVDILGMFDIWHVMNKCTVIAKHELLYAFPFGLAAWLAGLIFVDRRDSRKAQNQVNTAAEDIKKDKIKLWVYPEGKRHNTGKIHEFKKGAFHMAISAQIPILPVVFSHFYFLNSYEKRFDPGEVIITVLPPISTEGISVDQIDDLIKRTKTVMETTFYEQSKKVKNSKNVSVSSPGASLS